MHEQLAEYIVASTKDVFSMMLGVDELATAKPELETNGPRPSAGVIAWVGLGGTWSGTGGISCTPAQACRIATQMLGQEYPAVDADVLDAVGEIANMVIGNVKTHLESVVGPMALSVPTVIHGSSFTTHVVGRHEWTVVEFECAGEKIFVQVAVARSGGAGLRFIESTKAA